MRRNVSRTGIVRRQRHQRFAIKDWQDCLPDVPAFVIGNGPSLKHENLSLLENYFSIGINRCFMLLDPTILLWQDISLWNSEGQRLHNTQALKVARDTADPKRIYYNFHLRAGQGYKFENKTHILNGRGSTGPLAVQLAVAMGCRPVVLLGMDCQRGPNNETDFYGQNPFWLPHTLDNCQKGLQYVMENCPVEVINCSNNDWPRQSLADVVNGINPQYARGRQSYVRQILRVK